MKKLYALLLCCLFFVLFPQTSEASDRGKVGQLPVYPAGCPKVSITHLLLGGEPVVTFDAPYKARISFETVKPCPATHVYYGVYEPEAQLQLPRYRMEAKEKLKKESTHHQLIIDFKNLLQQTHDIDNFKINDGGVIVYRLEIYDPEEAAARYFDRRFAFKHDSLLPTIIEGPFIDQITPTSALLSWETDQPVLAFVFLSKENGVADTLKIDKSSTTHFELKLDRLQPGARYSYQIQLQPPQPITTSRRYTFQTPGENQSTFTFAILGDSQEGCGGEENQYSGVNYQTLQRLALDAGNRGAEFIIITGDLVSGAVTNPLEFERQLEAFKDAVEPVGHAIPIYEMMGNHEIVKDVYDCGDKGKVFFDKTGLESTEAIFAKEFVNPTNGPEAEVDGAPPYRENVYYFDYGNSRFLIMNNVYWRSGNPEEYGCNLEGYILDNQLAWLKNVMKQTKDDPSIKHLFLLAHEPLFPNSAHAKDAMWYNGGEATKNKGIDRRYVVERRDEILQALSETGKAVSANFGHEHSYQRMLISNKLDARVKNPLWQIVSGGAGGPYYARHFDVPWADQVTIYSPQRNYTLFQVEGDTVTLEVYGYTGELIDRAMLVPFQK